MVAFIDFICSVSPLSYVGIISILILARGKLSLHPHLCLSALDSLGWGIDLGCKLVGSGPLSLYFESSQEWDQTVQFFYLDEGIRRRLNRVLAVHQDSEAPLAGPSLEVVLCLFSFTLWAVPCFLQYVPFCLKIIRFCMFCLKPKNHNGSLTTVSLHEIDIVVLGEWPPPVQVGTPGWGFTTEGKVLGSLGPVAFFP